MDSLLIKLSSFVKLIGFSKVLDGKTVLAAIWECRN